jgi:hypothetical protein
MAVELKKVEHKVERKTIIFLRKMATGDSEWVKGQLAHCMELGKTVETALPQQFSDAVNKTLEKMPNETYQLRIHLFAFLLTMKSYQDEHGVTQKYLEPARERFDWFLKVTINQIKTRFYYVF